jgi:sarcosine oxidase
LKVIVVGLGGAGSAILYHLARRGHETVGVDRYAPPHCKGSSHGGSRIFRFTYGNSRCFMPLALRARTLWREMERKLSRQLFQPVGSLDVAPENSEHITSNQACCEQFDLEYEMLSSASLNQRFPAYNFGRQFVGLYQADGGVIDPELTVSSHVSCAEEHGAKVITNCRMTTYEESADGVRIQTLSQTLDAEYLVVAAGPWLAELIGSLEADLIVERQVMGWFCCAHSISSANSLPPANIIQDDGRHYAVCSAGLNAIKVNCHNHRRQTGTPESFDDECDDHDAQLLAEFVGAHMNAFERTPSLMQRCFFTNAESEKFWIRPVSALRRVIVVSPCSGHGFKFVPAIGELVADFIEGRSPTYGGIVTSVLNS